MTLIQQTDQDAQALALLISQFKNSEKMKALVSSFVAQLQELENVFFALLNERALDTSEGLQLDGIGQIVGLLRDGLDDDNYRDALKTKILINLSSGTIEDLVTILQRVIVNQDVTENTAILRESDDAEFEIEIVNAVVNGPALAKFIRTSRAAGVRSYVIWRDPFGIPAFSFGPDPDVNGDSAGFGPDLSSGGFINASE